MCDTIYYLIIVIYYFLIFLCKKRYFRFGDLFPYF